MSVPYLKVVRDEMGMAGTSLGGGGGGGGGRGEAVAAGVDTGMAEKGTGEAGWKVTLEGGGGGGGGGRVVVGGGGGGGGGALSSQ